jgi:hypothetical protein
MKKILLSLTIILLVASCGSKNDNEKLEGFFDITESSCNGGVTPGQRVVLFAPESDNKLNVRIVESSLNNIPVSFPASISFNDKKFVLKGNAVINTQAENYNVEFIIDAILDKDARSFNGIWVEKDDFNTTICNITAHKKN